jgi:mannose-6-phosphate isomerase-like protein (cupin superfamily)
VNVRILTGESKMDAAGLRVERSNPALAVLEIALAANAAGPPLYEHESLDETFYVLAGRVTFRVGEAAFIALPGAPVVAPGGVPHSYANHHEEPARLVAVCSPGAAGSTDVHRSLIVGPPLEP